MILLNKLTWPKMTSKDLSLFKLDIKLDLGHNITKPVILLLKLGIKFLISVFSNMSLNDLDLNIWNKYPQCEI